MSSNIAYLENISECGTSSSSAGYGVANTYDPFWTYPQWYSYPYRDYSEERAKEIKGWIEGFLEAKEGKLTKADLKKITEKLEGI